MDAPTVDAYAPPEIAKRIAEVAQKKSTLDAFRLFILAILAGVFIGFGAEFFTLVVHDSGLPFGLNKLVGGLVFSLGLILVILAGAELFTGNTLMVMGFVEGIIDGRGLLRNWALAYLGNFLGSLSMVLLIYYSTQWAMNDTAVGAKALLIANAKVNLGFVEAFVRGILCNALVCLAVWLCFGARSTTDKILAIIFPITAFVASGFEHCVANMYFVPLGILLRGEPSVLTAAATMAGRDVALTNLTWAGFLINNLLPVTLGNIIGGGFLVGLVYWAVYLREFSFRTLLRMGEVGFRLLFFVRATDLYALLSRKQKGRRPLPRDLTTLVGEEVEHVDQADV